MYGLSKEVAVTERRPLVWFQLYMATRSNHVLEHSSTLQPGHGIQQHSRCYTIKIKLLHSTHNVRIHKLIHEIIVPEQGLKEMT